MVRIKTGKSKEPHVVTQGANNRVLQHSQPLSGIQQAEKNIVATALELRDDETEVVYPDGTRRRLGDLIAERKETAEAENTEETPA